MKSPLTRRLFLVFAAILLLFSLLAGLLTAVFGRRALQENFEQSLLERARIAAESLMSENSPYLQEEEHPERPRGRGQGASRRAPQMRGRDLRFLATLLQSGVQILDANGRPALIPSQTEVESSVPDALLHALPAVFSGEEILVWTDTDTDAVITAGVPFFSSEEEILAALFLTEPVQGLQAFVRQAGVVFLAAAGLAALLMLLLSRYFAGRLSRPLREMSRATQRLAAGETGIETGIRQNDEIGALAKDIDILSMKLEEAERREDELEQLRRDFSAKLSHELKTPVAVMRASLEALEDGVIPPAEREQTYRALVEESRQLDRLIADLLELTALQNPQFRIEKKELDLLAVLKDAIRSQRSFAARKNIEIDLQTTNAALPFPGDYSRLRQMFLVVIQNAVKYTAEHATVTVSETGSAESFFITVTNPGPMLTKEQIDHLFTQFYRTDDSGPGFGLGLPIAKEIADRHNIRIVVESDRAYGTRFIFSASEGSDALSGRPPEQQRI